ncbi:hypothetical protein [Streptomyces sp. NPDC048521]|uniref:hypothetical protein n=1 Tax=Streptomyces sp. NPDC048521 TaxID=3365566 RepID=UPI0037186E30
MTTHLPKPHTRQPHVTTAGQPTPDAYAFLADLESAFNQATHPAKAAPTSYRDLTPVPAYGTNPPVPQPGRPPMSQSAVDYSARMISTGVASVLFSASVSGILIASGHANPTVVSFIVAAPAALAVPILALSRLVKRTKEVVEAAPATHHHHYNATVDQRTVNSTTRGIWASTHNQLPPGTTGE